MFVDSFSSSTNRRRGKQENKNGNRTGSALSRTLPLATWISYAAILAHERISRTSPNCSSYPLCASRSDGSWSLEWDVVMDRRWCAAVDTVLAAEVSRSLTGVARGPEALAEIALGRTLSPSRTNQAGQRQSDHWPSLLAAEDRSESPTFDRDISVRHQFWRCDLS